MFNSFLITKLRILSPIQTKLATAVGLLDNDPWGSPEDRPRKKTRVSTTHVDNLGDRHSSQTTE